MIYAQWYFTDEAEQEVGPYDTEKDAREAELLYGFSLDRNLTEAESKRFRELSEGTQLALPLAELPQNG